MQNIFYKNFYISEDFCRSYLSDYLVHSELEKSIKKYGIISPIITFKKNGKHIVLDGAKRLFIAKHLNKDVPFVDINVFSAEDAFKTILITNEQNFNFLEFARISIRIYKNNLWERLYTLLKKIAENYKYPLKIDLLKRIEIFPQCCIEGIVKNTLNWKMIYYAHYFTSKEWEKIFYLFLKFKINKNTQRNVIEKIILLKEKYPFEKLISILENSEKLEETLQRHIFSKKVELENKINQVFKNLPEDFRKKILIKVDFERRELLATLKIKNTDDLNLLKNKLYLLLRFLEIIND